MNHISEMLLSKVLDERKISLKTILHIEMEHLCQRPDIFANMPVALVAPFRYTLRK